MLSTGNWVTLKIDWDSSFRKKGKCQSVLFIYFISHISFKYEQNFTPIPNRNLLSSFSFHSTEAWVSVQMKDRLLVNDNSCWAALLERDWNKSYFLSLLLRQVETDLLKLLEGMTLNFELLGMLFLKSISNRCSSSQRPLLPPTAAYVEWLQGWAVQHGGAGWYVISASFFS